jgi:hypothetical protein
MVTRIQLRHDSAANWASVNPVLLQGEFGLETDTNKGKFGNGVLPYNSLPYHADAVWSVNSQTGAVVLDADDINDASTTNKFVTSGDLTNLSNLSGVNTGDQDLSGYELLINKDANDGYAGLDGTGRLVDSQLPLVNLRATYCGIAEDLGITSSGGLVTVPDNVGTFIVGTGEGLQDLPITGISNHSLTDDAENYIVAKYNAGSPVFDVIIDASLIDYIEYLPYAMVFKRAGSNNVHTEMQLLQTRHEIGANHARLLDTSKYGRNEGALTTQGMDSSLNYTLNGGVVWVANYPYTIPAVTTATRQFECVYAGSEWLIASHTSPKISNTCYNDTAGNTRTSGYALEVGTIYKIVSQSTLDFTTAGAANNTIGTIFKCTVTQNLGTGDSVLDGDGYLGAGEFGITYIYRGIENEDHLYTVMGTQSYASLALAQASSTLASLPPLITSHALFVGRVIIEQGATTATLESAFSTVFAASSAITDHGTLTGLADDDHLQYHTDSRGDARYPLKNSAITPGTNLKITYDAKGLVTAGTTATLASADYANQGTTTTVLHGNAAGNPSWGGVVEADMILSDNTTHDVSTANHGFVPKLPASSTDTFLHDDGTWAHPAGYTIQGSAASHNPTDGTTYYIGTASAAAPTTTAGIVRMYIPRAGTITSAYVFCSANGTAGSNQAWVMNIRLNNTTNTQIASVSATTAQRVWSNTALAITVAQGDYIEIQSVSPTWTTNPTAVTYAAVIYIE